MNETLKKSIRGCVSFFIVGVLCALAVPALANFLGPDIVGATALSHASSVSAPWMGLLFGAFGAFAPAIEKAYDLITGGDLKEAAVSGAGKDHARQVNITVVQAPQQSQGQAVLETKHRSKVESDLNRPWEITR